MKLRRRSRGLSRVFAVAMAGPRLSSLVLILIAALLFLVSAARPGALQPVRTGVADLFAPVLAAVNAPVQHAAGYVRAATGIAGLQEENARLREENARLREWYQTAQVLTAENKSLQDLLNIKLPPQHRYITAKVIADPGRSYVRTALVLAGAEAGVDKGQAVLAGDGLAGRVIEAGQKASRVLLLTDINSRIPVFVVGGGDHAVLAGNNDGPPLLDHLSPDSKVAEGARVMTSGLGGFFPYGLPVGTVVRTEDGAWAVAPFADTERMMFVRVVNSGEDPNLREGGL